MASGSITSWEIDGETVETASDFSFWGSKITADGDCSHEIKRRLLLGRKVMTNLDSIFKSRDITLPTKFRLLKAMVFPVVMYGCESWTVKKAEHRRIDAFELWCWRRLLRVPWTARIIDLLLHSKYYIIYSTVLGFSGSSVGKESTGNAGDTLWVRSLGQEDPLEEGMATHSSILAWRILWTEEPGGLPSVGSQKS